METPDKKQVQIITKEQKKQYNKTYYEKNKDKIKANVKESYRIKNNVSDKLINKESNLTADKKKYYNEYRKSIRDDAKAYRELQKNNKTS
jgi:hypothetical protein